MPLKTCWRYKQEQRCYYSFDNKKLFFSRSDSALLDFAWWVQRIITIDLIHVFFASVPVSSNVCVLYDRLVACVNGGWCERDNDNGTAVCGYVCTQICTSFIQYFFLLYCTREGSIFCYAQQRKYKICYYFSMQMSTRVSRNLLWDHWRWQ